MIGGDSLQTADRYRLFLDAAAATGRLARTVADAAEYSREDVGFAVFHVRIAELPLGNHANVRRNVGVGGTAPLTVYDLVEVLGIGGICWLHSDDKPVRSLLPGTFQRPLRGASIAGSRRK